MNLHSYWAQIFLFPKAVMEEIEALCRRFVWCGHVASGGRALLKWELVCQPKKSAGLGFKNLVVWNKAFIRKKIWDIALKKKR